MVADKQTASNAARKKEQFMVIPRKDMEWVIKQSAPVYKLFMECWLADPFGTRPEKLNTTVPYSSFKKAKKILLDAGLFLFERVPSSRDNRETVCWNVKNLHGIDQKHNWGKSKIESNREPEESQKASNISDKEYLREIEVSQRASNLPETQAQQKLQKPLLLFTNTNKSSTDLLVCSSPLTPPASRGVVEEASIEEEEMNIPEEAVLKAQQDMQLEEAAYLVTQDEIENAYFDMVEQNKEPSEPIKKAMLDLIGTRYESALKTIAYRQGWSLPTPPPLPVIDKSFLMKRNKWNKRSRDQLVISYEL